MLIWAQNQLDEKAAYPHINDLSTAILEDPAIWEGAMLEDPALWKVKLGVTSGPRVEV